MSESDPTPADERPDAMTTTADNPGLPDDWEEMSAEEKQAWADEKEEDLSAAADEAMDLSSDEQRALDILSEPVERDRATVTLNGQSVDVRTYLDADREEALQRVANNPNDFDAIRGTMAETLAWLIDDPEYGGETGEKVWRAYAERFGTTRLAELFYQAVDPALSKMEDAEATREFRGE